MDNTLAAQYLRVSTDRQEYSLSFQSAGIATYALEHNFTICETYVDEAKSGLEIRRRKGLTQLLHDVLAGKHPYKAILVYDVSRWGRFQDPDESAHYEFLCKTAGVRVHYCAEHFRNDGYLPNVILKTLKRIMAGEYSRELSEKVFAGLTRVARDGFRTGGLAGYGYRRMLISANRTPKGEIPSGERKSMSNERVRLILGPANEVHWVKEIYRMFTSGDRTVRSIADELNEWKVPFLDGRKWQDSSVRRILMNPKYTGTGVYNQRRSRLGSKMTPNAETEWIVVPGAFEPIIDPMTFESAQEVFRNSHWNLSNEKLLEALRSILREKGKLSMPLLRGVPNTLTKEGYARRFGTLTRAFELVGYYSRQSITIVHRNAIWKVRTALMESLVELFPREISIHTRGSVRRNCLRLRNGNRVAVRVCRRVNNVTNGPVWILQPARREKRLISLLGCLNADNSAMEMVYVLPPIANRGQVRISRNHSWFKKGIRLENLSSFREAVTHMQGQGALGGGRRPKGWLSDDARAAIVEALRFRNAAKKNNVP